MKIITIKLKLAAVGLMPLTLLALTSCSSPPPYTPGTVYQPPSTAVQPTGPQIIGSGVTAGTASGMWQVESVDTAARSVVLRRADGTTAAFTVGPDAVNFDKIKAGDKIISTVSTSWVAYLVKGGVPPSSVTNAAFQGQPKGSQPGGVMIRTVEYHAKILDINYATRKVVLQYGTNDAKRVTAGSEVNLTAVRVNDDVLIRTTEAAAIALVNP
jgi:hypothetical protein